MCPASQQNTQPCAIEIPKHMAHTQPSANRPTGPTSPTSPTFFVPTLCIAQCALPAGGNALCSLVDAMHMAHGGEPHFSPRVPPFRPCVVERPAARYAASLRLEALASSPPRAVRRRLSARWRHGAAAMWSAVGLAPSRASCLRLARHRRASPRVLELHRDVLPNFCALRF